MKIKRGKITPAQFFFMEIILIQFIFTYYHLALKKEFNIIDFLAGATMCYIAFENTPEDKGGPKNNE